MKYLSLSAIAAVSLLACTACQSTKPQTSPSRFSRADTNKDGKLSRDEANAYYVIGVFDSLDINKDGKLVLAEGVVVGAPATMAKFQRMDANKDGKVTKEEALRYGRTQGMVQRAFPKADKNKDGSLSVSEVTAFYGDKEGSPF